MSSAMSACHCALSSTSVWLCRCKSSVAIVISNLLAQDTHERSNRFDQRHPSRGRHGGDPIMICGLCECPPGCELSRHLAEFCFDPGQTVGPQLQPQGSALVATVTMAAAPLTGSPSWS